MENGWYFPSSFEAWKQHGTDEVLGIETEIESGLITNGTLTYMLLNLTLHRSKQIIKWSKHPPGKCALIVVNYEKGEIC